MKKHYNLRSILSILSCLGCLVAFGQTTFNYTGAYETYTVPAGVNSISIECYGASGWSGTYAGGEGGYTYGELAVTPGQDLYIYVGGQGQVSLTDYTPEGGGWNGGGDGQTNTYVPPAVGGGGGASDVRTVANANPMDITSLNSRLIVAGGGGGSTNNTGCVGGNGGGLIGQDGFQYSGYPQATGGTQSAGGSSGGALGQGGNADGTMTPWNGGGGGGYYGGGISTAHSSGGGGSSYIGGVTNGSMTQGGNVGDGYIVITELCAALTTIVSASEVCEGTEVTLAATGNGTITWNNGITNNVAFTPPVGTTTYTATSSDNGDCGFNVDIIVNEMPTPDAGLDVTQCGSAGPVTLTAAGTADSLYWSGGVQDGVPFTPAMGSTMFILTGANATGCSTTDTVYVNFGDPQITLSSSDEMFGNDGAAYLTIDAGFAPFTFDWDNDGTGDNDDNNDLTGVAGGTYNVTMTDASGCTVNASITVGSQLGLGDLENGANIFPNPATTSLTIEMSGEFSFTLIDAQGKVVLNGTALDKEVIDVAPFDNGMYMLQLESADQVLIHKVVKK